ncbi:MAG TPA: hypothetical protein V6C58_22730 [Allocoleopsis sp.]
MFKTKFKNLGNALKQAPGKVSKGFGSAIKTANNLSNQASQHLDNASQSLSDFQQSLQTPENQQLAQNLGASGLLNKAMKTTDKLQGSIATARNITQQTADISNKNNYTGATTGENLNNAIERYKNLKSTVRPIVFK